MQSFHSLKCTRSANCEKEGPFCINKGITFINKCELDQALCNSNSNSNQIIHNGVCTKCLLDKITQQRINSSKAQSNIFIPECDSQTALYLPTQCHQATGTLFVRL